MNKENVARYMREFYPAIKMEETMQFAGERIQLEIVIVREISQTLKDNTFFPHLWLLRSLYRYIKPFLYIRDMKAEGDQESWGGMGKREERRGASVCSKDMVDLRLSL